MENNFLPNPMLNQEMSLSALTAKIDLLSKTPNKFLLSVISDKEVFNSLVKFYSSFERDVMGSLLAAEDSGVAKKHINQILKLVKDEAKLRSKEAGRQKAPILVKSAMPNAPVAAETILPTGYYFTSNLGISRYKENDDPKWAVSICPIFITEILHNPIENTERVKITWLSGNNWRSVIVERKIIAKKTSIVDLSSNGLPITSSNAESIVDYLFEYENTNKNSIKKTRVTYQMGWTGDMEGFLWGRTLFASPQASSSAGKKLSLMFLGRDFGDEQIADGFTSTGDYSEWASLANDVLTYPDVAFTLYTALAVPLLPIFGVNNFSLELSNPSSSGKTTALLFAASAWGVPSFKAESFVNTWNSTPVWIGRALSTLNGLPFFLDETKLAKSNDKWKRSENVIADTIYTVASGRDKARGTLRGTERIESFRTVLIMTGETPSLDQSNDGGVRGRLIDLWGPPFNGTDETTKGLVDRINRTIQNHHGHAGPRLIQFILSRRDDWQLWREAFESLRDKLSKADSMSAIEMRLAEYVAAVATAIPIIHAAMPELRRDIPVRGLLESVWGRARKEASSADLGTRALEIVRDWILGNQDKLFSPGAATNGQKWNSDYHSGFWDMLDDNWTFVGLTRDCFMDIMKRNNLKLTEIARIWDAKSWLIRDNSSQGYQKQIPIPGTSINSSMSKINLYCIHRKAFESVQSKNEC